MIIEPRIHIGDEELVALKSSESMDVELALEIVGRVRRAIRSNSFNVVQFVRDHVQDEGALVDAGEIEIRTDAHGEEVSQLSPDDKVLLRTLLTDFDTKLSKLWLHCQATDTTVDEHIVHIEAAQARISSLRARLGL